MGRPPDDVALIVNGVRYIGWKGIRVTRTIEGLAGSFSLDITDKWGDSAPWPIMEGDTCRVEIGNGTDTEIETVIDGYVFKRRLAADATNRTMSVEGRDKAADIVDSSVLVPDSANKGNKWTYRNVDIAAFATAIAKQHGIRVSVQAGLVLKKDPLLTAHPGESGYEAIKRATGSSGVIAVSDGDGGIIITRAGTTHAAALVEGENIKSAEVDWDASDRFYQYLISSQPPGTDEAYGEATRVQASARDLSITRPGRVLLIRPDKGYNAAEAKRRADWEARIRAAKAEVVSIAVQGWRQPNKKLWPVNMLSWVQARNMIGVDGDMLISQAEFSISESGTVTQLHLVRPDALEPEPQSAVVGGEGAWKELAKGAS